jgi:hypothetical protein
MEVKVEFPKIPQLRGEENLQEWKQMLRQTLRVHGLIQYVDPGVAEPGAPVERELWEKKRAQVILLMLGSFNHIQQKLLNHGWDPDCWILSYTIAVDNRKSIALTILRCYVQCLYTRRPVATPSAPALVPGFVLPQELNLYPCPAESPPQRRTSAGSLRRFRSPPRQRFRVAPGLRRGNYNS